MFRSLAHRSTASLHRFQHTTRSLYSTTPASSVSTKVYALGHNTHGSLGLNSKAAADKEPLQIPQKFFRNSTISSLDAYASGTHVCALNHEGHAFLWGQNSSGQLGLGDENNKYGPVRNDYFINELNVSLSKVSCGEHHTLFASNDQRLFSAGYAGSSILGLSSLMGWSHALGYSASGNQTTPKEIETLRGQTIRSMDCGEYHSAAVTGDGALWMWGRGDWGRLGNGSNASSQIPKQLQSSYIEPGTLFDKVVCGHAFSMALTQDGTVYSWGKNDNSQLGLGHEGVGQLAGGAQFDCEKNPRLLANEKFFEGKRIVDIECGSVTSGAIDEDGKFYYWGRTLQVPTHIHQVGEIESMSLGSKHALLLGKDGRVFMIGSFGRMGNRQHVEEITEQIPTKGRVKQVVGGSDFSLFLCEEEG